MIGVVDELHVGLVADDEDVAVGELLHDACAMRRIDRRAGRVARVAQHHRARARRHRWRQVVPRQAVRLLIGKRRFNGDGARRTNLHVVIGEVGRREDDFLARTHEGGQRGREAVIGAGGDDQVLETALDADVLAQTLGEHPSQRRAARVGRVPVHIRCEQRRFGGAKRGRGRRKEGQCLPERDDAMSFRAQGRGAHVQGIERRQLDVEHARRDAHIEKISPGSCDIFRAMTIEAPALPRPMGGRHDRQFYTGMSIAAAIVVFVGFAPTYFLRGSDLSTPLPAYLRVHGFLFSAWIVLFVAQTSLVAVRRTDLHRRLGWAGAVLAFVMVIVGTNAGITAMRGRFPDQGDAALSFLTTPLFSMVAFAALVTAAIRLRRDPQTHKRLMLLATISILDAAVARLPFEFLRSSTWNYIPTTDVLLAAAILYDLVSRRTVHRAYIWGGLLLVIEQALRIPVGETDAWKALALAMIGGGT